MEMDFKRGDPEVVLLVSEEGEAEEGSGSGSGSDGSSSSSCCSPTASPTCQCRVCYEEEEEISTTMETPCGCSGSLKYAHRVCIQRWCDEKGSTLCEICLQSFEPDYTVAQKKALIEVGVTIRGSLEVPREGFPTSPHSVAGGDENQDLLIADSPGECSPVPAGSATWCRSVAVGFTVVLLLRHLFSVITLGAADQYAFTLLTVFLLRASGILLPLYIVLKTISAIQQIRQQRRHAVVGRRLHLQPPPSLTPVVPPSVVLDSTPGPGEVQRPFPPDHHVIQVDAI